MSTDTSAAARELLEWIARRPRTYVETMEAWRTHCPRLAVWDDAVIDGLVRVAGGNVHLTARGQAILDRN
jgi:hypothetical protein